MARLHCCRAPGHGPTLLHRSTKDVKCGLGECGSGCDDTPVPLSLSALRFLTVFSIIGDSLKDQFTGCSGI